MFIAWTEIAGERADFYRLRVSGECRESEVISQQSGNFSSADCSRERIRQSQRLCHEVSLLS